MNPIPPLFGLFTGDTLPTNTAPDPAVLPFGPLLSQLLAPPPAPMPVPVVKPPVAVDTEATSPADADTAVADGGTLSVTGVDPDPGIRRADLASATDTRRLVGTAVRHGEGDTGESWSTAPTDTVSAEDDATPREADGVSPALGDRSPAEAGPTTLPTPVPAQAAVAAAAGAAALPEAAPQTGRTGTPGEERAERPRAMDELQTTEGPETMRPAPSSTGRAAGARARGALLHGQNGIPTDTAAPFDVAASTLVDRLRQEAKAAEAAASPVAEARSAEAAPRPESSDVAMAFRRPDGTPAHTAAALGAIRVLDLETAEPTPAPQHASTVAEGARQEGAAAADPAADEPRLELPEDAVVMRPARDRAARGDASRSESDASSTESDTLPGAGETMLTSGGGSAADGQGGEAARSPLSGPAQAVGPGREVAPRTAAAVDDAMPVGVSAALEEALVDQVEGMKLPGRTDRVTVEFTDDQGAAAGTVRVAVRGDRVEATITPLDGKTGGRLAAGIHELRDNLVRQGFSEARVTVREPQAPVTGTATGWTPAVPDLAASAAGGQDARQGAADDRGDTHSRWDEERARQESAGRHHRQRQRKSQEDA